MTESSESKLCRLCGCDSIDNKHIFDGSEVLLTKLRTTFSLVVSIIFFMHRLEKYFIIDLWTGRSLFCF